VAALEGPPSPPGDYDWGGWRRRYDFGRISALLGRRPDGVLAKVISCPTRNVAEMRKRLGVPPFRILTGLEHMAGKVPDTDLAKMAGCSVKGVADWRRRKGIKRYPRGRGHADRLVRQYLADLEKVFGA